MYVLKSTPKNVIDIPPVLHLNFSCVRIATEVLRFWQWILNSLSTLSQNEFPGSLTYYFFLNRLHCTAHLQLLASVPWQYLFTWSMYFFTLNIKHHCFWSLSLMIRNILKPVSYPWIIRWVSSWNHYKPHSSWLQLKAGNPGFNNFLSQYWL